MKKWRISRLCTLAVSNGSFTYDRNILNQQEYLRISDSLSIIYWLDENELMVVEVCKKTFQKRERLTGRCQEKNNRIHSQLSWILKMV